MKVYIDFVLFLNFMFDFLLLMSVSVLLRRNTNINRIIIGSFIGSLTTILLFFKINNFELFCIKIFISLFMILASFGFKSIKYFFKNCIFLYLVSFFLGGILYSLNIQFSYKNSGLVFFHNGISVNVIFIIILSPIIIYFYVKQLKQLKNNYANYYNVRIKLFNKEYKLIGFLDTGHKLKDPYFNRPIILLNKNKIDLNFDNYCYVPYSTITEKGLLKCVSVNDVYIDNVKVQKNVLLGFIKDNINIDGVDCILQTKILEG